MNADNMGWNGSTFALVLASLTCTAVLRASLHAVFCVYPPVAVPTFYPGEINDLRDHGEKKPNKP
jgi:hypothetical protein